MDGGLAAFDRLEHAHLADRFKSIFRLKRKLPVVYVPGNHDTGLYLPRTQAAHTREQFKDGFGPLSGIKEFGNVSQQADVTLVLILYGQHSIIWIDSMGLLEENVAKEIPGAKRPAHAFVDKLTQCKHRGRKA